MPKSFPVFEGDPIYYQGQPIGTIGKSVSEVCPQCAEWLYEARPLSQQPELLGEWQYVCFHEQILTLSHRELMTKLADVGRAPSDEERALGFVSAVSIQFKDQRRVIPDTEEKA